MKKFRIKVVKEAEYEIEVDDNVWTEKELEDFRKVFYQLHSTQEVAETVAEMYFEQGQGCFLEGFGIPMVNGRDPYFVYGDNKNSISKDIIVHEISEDRYIEESEEI